MEIIKAAEIDEERPITYLIYANPGIGKTYTAKFLVGKTLIVDFDGKSGVLKGTEDTDIVRFNPRNAYAEFPSVLKEIHDSLLEKYDNIVLDNISELERSMLAQLGREGKNNRVPSQANYQQVQFTIIDGIRYVNSWMKTILITAWEDTDVYTTTNGQIFNRSYPKISKAIRMNVMGLADVVGRLVYDEKEDKRGFLLQPTDGVFAKNQISNDKGVKQDGLFKLGKEQ